jgi:hypothetical protein
VRYTWDVMSSHVPGWLGSAPSETRSSDRRVRSTSGPLA